jgi:hypothetical protein
MTACAVALHSGFFSPMRRATARSSPSRGQLYGVNQREHGFGQADGRDRGGAQRRGQVDVHHGEEDSIAILDIMGTESRTIAREMLPA